MATETKIQWTDSTFNPWRGCTKVASGCTNCYADTLAKRNPKTLGIWGPNGTRVLASAAMWKDPLKWNREAAASGQQHRVFCASLADIFEDWPGEIKSHTGQTLGIGVDGKLCFEGTRPAKLDDLRIKLFDLIDATPNLTWQILTKRPGNIRRMWPAVSYGTCDCDATNGHQLPQHRKNVHLLFSASDQESLEAGVGELLECRDLVPVLGLSLEPLVGPIDLSGWLGDVGQLQGGPHVGKRTIDWVIVGGESGPGARPCNVEWIRSIVKQCKEAGVPCFVKQLGTLPESENDADAASSKWPKTKFALNTLMLADKKGGDIEEWPIDLRVRQMPGVIA